jgi:hypothetical protein
MNPRNAELFGVLDDARKFRPAIFGAFCGCVT